MNRENIQRLLDFYEAGAPEYDFKIGEWLILPDDAPIPTLCGSSGCIAGSAYIMAKGSNPVDPETTFLMTQDGVLRRHVCAGEVEGVAMEWLGISLALADTLFCGNLMATSKDVADALRNILEGRSPWS